MPLLCSLPSEILSSVIKELPLGKESDGAERMEALDEFSVGWIVREKVGAGNRYEQRRRAEKRQVEGR